MDNINHVELALRIRNDFKNNVTTNDMVSNGSLTKAVVFNARRVAEKSWFSQNGIHKQVANKKPSPTRKMTLLTSRLYNAYFDHGGHSGRICMFGGNRLVDVA